MPLLQYLRIAKHQPKSGPSPIELTMGNLRADPNAPLSLSSLNNLDDEVKRRIYRVLIPQRLLARFDINPITWRGPDKSPCVKMDAEVGSGKIQLTAWSPFDPDDPFYTIELADNAFNSVDLNWLVLSDPNSERFNIDVDSGGASTALGTTRRNQQTEEQAMLAGLAPGQIRTGLRFSTDVFQNIEIFLIAIGQRSISLEPLSYSSAWVFERRGFAYMKGHGLMKLIDEEFRPGGRLHRALDGSTPFRQPDQWRSVRGRAWAIQDGILDVLDRQWNDIRMAKQLGRHAEVNTFENAIY